MSHLQFYRATLLRDKIASVTWRVAQLHNIRQFRFRIEHFLVVLTVRYTNDTIHTAGRVYSQMQSTVKRPASGEKNDSVLVQDCDTIHTWMFVNSGIVKAVCRR